MEKMKRGKELEANEWWLVLSRLADHKLQARCAAVCKDWNTISKTLPQLHIKVPRVFGECQARKFIKAALHGRSCLRDLHLHLDLTLLEPQPRRLFTISEHHIFNLLEDVSTSLEVLQLTLRDASYTELWSRLFQHFGKLQRLHIWYGFIFNPPPLDLQFPNLKEIELMWGGNVYAPVIHGILQSCSLLEKLSISYFIGPLVVESHSLLSLILIGKVPSGPRQSDLVIKASNLRDLVILNSKNAKVYKAKNLQKMQLSCCEFFVDQPQPNLQSLHVSKSSTEKDIDFSHVLKLVSTAKELKWLKIEGDFTHTSDITLQELIPERVQVLLFDAMLLKNLVADEAFQRANTYEILQLLEQHYDIDKLPRFGLKKVAVDMRDLELDYIGTYLLEIIVQLLRCSPLLELLLIRPPSVGSGWLNLCGFDYLHNYVNSCHVCWDANCCFGSKCDTPCFDALYKCMF